MPYVLCQSTLTQRVLIREQRYSKEKNMQIKLFKRRDIHTVDLAGKCSIESATLLEGRGAWVYMEHELGGDR
jgi:hypothetical protein